MIYHFCCEQCGEQREISASIKEGPPKRLDCINCNAKMHQEFGGWFILKGDFPGKQITREREGTIAASAAEEFLHKDEIIKKENKEVLQQRRKGKDTFKEYARHNKKKVRRYKENLKKGIKAK